MDVKELGYFDTPGSARDVYVVSDTADPITSLTYIADGSSGLRILNTEDKSHPVEVAWFDTSGYAEAVKVQGNYAYLAGGEEGLQVIQIPTNLGSLTLD